VGEYVGYSSPPGLSGGVVAWIAREVGAVVRTMLDKLGAYVGEQVGS